MRMYDLIEKKKRRLPHTRDELEFICRGAASGAIPDSQLSAWLMAVYFSGMTESETLLMTEAMARSGEMLDLSTLGESTVDKHSTGGVGDKTTLIITPIVASVGARVAKMSGRGLGFTGGTVDKLESVGVKTGLSQKEFFKIAGEVGAVIAAQSGNLTPADKRLYSLRDITATVDSLPLIASSVMSKKLALGARSIVLDVKCGRGAFAKNESDARSLAEAMIKIGRGAGRKMAAVISDMSEPLGYAVGNALEVFEAKDVLLGKGPLDLTELCITLSSLMISLALGIERSEAERRAREAIASGAALEKFYDWLIASGADKKMLLSEKPPRARLSRAITAKTDGFVLLVDAEKIGKAALLSGAGRERAEDSVCPLSGVILEKKRTDAVKRGEVLATVYSDNEDRLAAAADEALLAFSIGSKPVARTPLVLAVLE